MNNWSIEEAEKVFLHPSVGGKKIEHENPWGVYSFTLSGDSYSVIVKEKCNTLRLGNGGRLEIAFSRAQIVLYSYLSPPVKILRFSGENGQDIALIAIKRYDSAKENEND